MMAKRSLLYVAALVAIARSAIAGPAFSHTPRLVDAGGRTIGTFLGPRVYRRENGLVLELSAQREFNGGIPEFLHEQADCSDPRLTEAKDRNLTREVVAAGAVAGTGPVTTGYYAGDPIAVHIFRAQEGPSFYGQYTAARCAPTIAGYCCLSSEAVDSEITAGPTTVIDLSGFVPPFSIR